MNGAPPHIHHREDESFYILDGTFSALVGEDSSPPAPPEGIVEKLMTLVPK